MTSRRRERLTFLSAERLAPFWRLFFLRVYGHDHDRVQLVSVAAAVCERGRDLHGHDRDQREHDHVRHVHDRGDLPVAVVWQVAVHWLLSNI